MSIVRRKILLTGKNGQVGWELERSLQPLGQVFAFDHAGMDLANPDSIRRVIREIGPNLIVNAAAYTAVDKAESEPDLAMAINGIAPGIMADEAKKIDAVLVHYSTDYVFDGTKPTPYVEEDVTAPLNMYGKSKLAGEQAIQASDASYLIFRTSWVYGARGRNFLVTMLRLAMERDELRIVSDQFGAPTWCRSIAEATGLALAQVQSAAATCPLALGDRSGIYHLTNSGTASWHTFAKAIIEKATVLDILHPVDCTRPQTVRSVRVTAITTNEYPLPATRPSNSNLNGDKFARTFGLALPSWEASLDQCLQDLH